MKLALLEPANTNASETPTWRIPECPAPEVSFPKHDETLTSLHVIESDHMDAHHFRALAVQMKSREVGTSRTGSDGPGSGLRRKRSR